MRHKAIAPVLLLAGPLFCLQSTSLQTVGLAVEKGARDLWHVRPDRPEYCQELASRLAALPEVAASFALLLAESRGQQTAEVTTAHPLNDTQRNQIAARLTEAGYSNVRLVERLDPSILGGMILKIGSRLYDTSIKSRLQRLSYAMKGAA